MERRSWPQNSKASQALGPKPLRFTLDRDLLLFYLRGLHTYNRTPWTSTKTCTSEEITTKQKGLFGRQQIRNSLKQNQAWVDFFDPTFGPGTLLALDVQLKIIEP